MGGDSRCHYVGSGSISKAIEIQMENRKGNGCNRKEFRMIEVGKLLKFTLHISKQEKITHFEREKIDAN